MPNITTLRMKRSKDPSFKKTAKLRPEREGSLLQGQEDLGKRRTDCGTTPCQQRPLLLFIIIASCQPQQCLAHGECFRNTVQRECMNNLYLLITNPVRAYCLSSVKSGTEVSFIFLSHAQHNASDSQHSAIICCEACLIPRPSITACRRCPPPREQIQNEV